MKNREYQIKIYSISRFIIAIIVVLCSLLFFRNEYLPKTDNKIISILQFSVILVISFYLANKIGIAKAKVIFKNDGINHIWERRFILSWEKNIMIPWDLVDNYVFEEDRTFDSFTINLKNKTRYKINRLNILPIKDDFIKLVKEFPRLSNVYRNKMNIDTNSRKIKEGENIYASKSFKWIFYFLLFGFLILLLTKMNSPNSETTWASIGVIGSAVAFYWLMIRRQKKKN
jgi:hypothetical protein